MDGADRPADCDSVPVRVSKEAERLLAIWLSPSFPVGAYAYSHGLEAAVARGLIANAQDAQTWLRRLLTAGSLKSDLILCSLAARAMQRREFAAIAELNMLALALQPSGPRYLETSQQGTSFLAAMLAAWPAAGLQDIKTACGDAVAYPVAVGASASAHGAAVTDILSAFAYAFLQNLTSAAIRLSIVGQTDAQKAIAALSPDVARAAVLAATADINDIATSTLSSDLASLEHEALYSRIFRS